MTMSAETSIEQYPTIPLQFNQTVISSMDNSIEILIVALSRPIIQKIVDSSNLNFDSILIEKPTEDSFLAIINGEMSQNAPIDAVVSFPVEASLINNGVTIGTMKMPDVKSFAGVAKLDNVQSQFTISDKEALGNFTSQSLQSDSVSFQIFSSNITVTSLSLSVSGIKLDKTVKMKGANGFKDSINIVSFKLPSDDKKKGGITTVINADLKNQGAFGMDVGTLLLDVIFEGTKVGEVSSNGLVINPAGKTDMQLGGRLIPQTGDGLKVVTKLFALFLASQPIPLTTRGTGVVPAISWLETAIVQLAIDTVLPPQNLGKLITGVSINDLTLVFTKDTAYNPDSSSKNLVAHGQIPFGFSIDIIQVQRELDIIVDGVSTIKLVLPPLDAKTIPISSSETLQKFDVVTSYKNIPMKAFDDVHTSFNNFIKDLTLKKSKSFKVQGSVNTLAKTAIGTIPLNNISVDVTSELLGFDSFNVKQATVDSIDVISGTAQTLNIAITSTLFNPTPISLSVGDVNFNFTVKDTNLGIVSINNLILQPKNNNISASVALTPNFQSASVFLDLFANFLANKTQPASLVGSENTTQIESLKNAMAGVKINTQMPGINKGLLISAYLIMTKDTPKTGDAFAGMTVKNPFTADITATGVIANITLLGKVIGSINLPKLPLPLVIKGKSQVKTPPMPIKVNLTLSSSSFAGGSSGNLHKRAAHKVLSSSSIGAPPHSYASAPPQSAVSAPPHSAPLQPTASAPPQPTASAPPPPPPININVNVNLTVIGLIDKFNAILPINQENVPVSITSS